MENIVQEINGIKYVLFQIELGLNGTGLKMAGQFDAKIKYYKGIKIFIEHVGSFFGTSKIKAKFLIPEDKAVEFSQRKLSEF